MPLVKPANFNMVNIPSDSHFHSFTAVERCRGQTYFILKGAYTCFFSLALYLYTYMDILIYILSSKHVDISRLQYLFSPNYLYPI